jgi:hypothetical protein
MVRAGLAAWNGDDLLVDGYDVWGEVRTRRIRHGENDSGRDSGRDSAQGRGGEAEGYERRGSGPECTAMGNARPPDDDGAQDCAGDVVERDSKERLAPVTSIDTARTQQPVLAMETSPILGTLAAVLSFRTGTTATTADRQALVGFYAGLPQRDADAALTRLKQYWQEERTPTVGAFLDSEGRSQSGLRGAQ